MKIWTIGLLLTAAITLILTLWKIAPGQSKLQVQRDQPHFPIVSGNNLNRAGLEFPRDFAGTYNLVIIPFKQRQQLIVNTWIPFAQEVEGAMLGFVYYELPTIYELPTLSRTFINEGMRAGITDEISRERTITLYLDKETFKDALQIPSEDDIYLFLVDQSGEILWSEKGAYTQEKAQSLIEFLEEQKE
jgi:hypothetical protein